MNTWNAFAVGYLLLLSYFFLFRFRSIHSDELERVHWRRTLLVIGAVLAIAFLIASPLTRSLLARSDRDAAVSLKVWASPRSGFYYCRGTDFYGRIRPGKYMTEAGAIESGYQPSLGQACH
jgi:hypothetical protein